MLSRGFTLIEVLVTLVILLFGLLGIAGLMAKGQRNSFEAYQRQEALSFGNDMIERIRANSNLNGTLPVPVSTYIAGAPVTAPLGQGVSYNQLLTGAITNCATSACDGNQMATYDLALWDGLLNGYTESNVAGGNRVGGIINAVGCIEDTGNTLATCPAAPAPLGYIYTQSVRVSVAWQGNDDTVAPLGALTCGTGLYGAETKRRVVALDSTLMVKCP